MALTGNTVNNKFLQGEKFMAKSVIVYVAEWCPWCHRVTDFLKQHRIKFKIRDVDNAKYAKESVKKSGQNGIPIIDVDGNIIIGFDEPKLKKFLKLK